MSDDNNKITKIDDLDSLWESREAVVKEFLPEIADQYNFLKICEGVAEGQKTKLLLRETELLWAQFVKLYCKDRHLYKLYLEAKQMGEELRQAIREDEADRRAVEGTLKPQFHKGEICGYVREYSDHLLALQLKAGNPDKYADRQKHQHEGVVLNLEVRGVERDPIDKATDVTDDITDDAGTG